MLLVYLTYPNFKTVFVYMFWSAFFKKKNSLEDVMFELFD